MTKFERIEAIWGNLEASYAKLGKGKSPVEFMKDLLNYDTSGTGKRALLKIVRESGEAPERVEKLAAKIEKAHDNLDYCVQHSITVNSIREFLQDRDESVSMDDLSVATLVEYVPAEQLFDAGYVLPFKRIIDDNGVRRLCNYVCTSYKYFCETENDVVALFQNLKASLADNHTLFGLAACISAGELNAPLIVATTSVADEIQERFDMERKKYKFNGKEYEMLKQVGQPNQATAHVLITEG